MIHGSQSRLATANALSPLIRAEMESLSTTGVVAVQLDEWGMANAADDASTLADLIRRTVDGIPIEVHLRFGYLDPLGRPTGRRRYRPWLPALASAVTSATLNVRQFDLAFAAAELNELDVLAELPARRIGLGVVDVTCTWVEPAALIAERLKQAVDHTQAERIWVTSDASFAALPRAVAIRKINSMVEAARTVRATFGVREAVIAPAPTPEAKPDEKPEPDMIPAGEMSG
jgi:5-methyltetrahydropteroyltriglutamate--homocysteine methyltransferase